MIITIIMIMTKKMITMAIQFSPLTDWVVRGDKRDNSAEILFQSFLHEALVAGSGMGRGVRSLTDVVHPAFPLPITYRL